jgi:hypothetical protein
MYTRLKAAVAAMAAHLDPNGVLIVEPWLTPEARTGRSRRAARWSAMIPHGL